MTVADRNLRSNQFALLGLASARRGAGVSLVDAVRHAGGAPALVDIAKAAVSGVMTTTAPALSQFGPIAAGFIAALRSTSVFDALLPDMLPAVIDQRFGLLTAHAAAGAGEEGQAAVATQLALSAGTLAERKAQAVIAASKTLMANANAIGLLERGLLDGAGRSTDTQFLTAIAAGAPTVASAGDTWNDVYTDLAAAVRGLPTGAQSRVHVALGVDCAKRLTFAVNQQGERVFPGMTINGGAIAELTVHVTDHLVNDVLVVDAAAFAGATGDVQLESSSAATLKLSTTPAMSAGIGSPPQPIEASVVSMFQTSSVATLVTRSFAFEMVRPGVVKIPNVQWGLVGSPPS